MMTYDLTPLLTTIASSSASFAAILGGFIASKLISISGEREAVLNYADLAEKADGSSERFRKLSAQIKDAETHMAEISLLRTHIINYAKTREVYADYRKAGYSKKFLAEHEPDILLHKAAKKYFDEIGIQKLPSVKSLNSEYSELSAKKKGAYADYRKTREEMRELLVVKANVDRILGIEKKRCHEKRRTQQEPIITT